MSKRKGSGDEFDLREGEIGDGGGFPWAAGGRGAMGALGAAWRGPKAPGRGGSR